jgi:poly(3-hydroxybutyrate) depolymerase/PKD repeat protein
LTILKNLTIASVLTFALVFSCAILSPFMAAAQGDQQKTTVSLGSGSTSGAWLHLPDDYEKTTTKYPLIVFIHGLGERGTDLNLVLRHGVPKMIANGANMQFTVGGKLFKFIVVSPQIPNGWASAGMVQGVIDDMKKRYRVDESRIYLTGLSAGGYGVLNYVASGTTYSNNVAAIVPVSTAAIDAAKVDGLCNVAASKIATWMLCGTGDGFIDNQNAYVEKINSCSPPVKAIGTSFAGGHDGGFWDKVYSVTNTYQTPNIYQWMLQYSRGDVSTEPEPEPEPVPNPVVAFTSSSISLQLPTASTTLDGSGSTAPNSTITGYAWEQKSGPSTASMTGKTTSKAGVSGLLAGTYVFTLTVTNAEGQSSAGDVTVQVAAAPATGGSKACSSCKFLIVPGTDGGAYINGNNLNAQPGDTVCVQAGNYTYIQFFNFTGSSEKPIVFINCGGQVRTGSSGNYGLIFSNCKYFKVTGSGSSDKYGFYTEGVTKHTSTGVAMGKGCTDYEAERIEITKSEAGIMAKINPDCDPESQYPNFAIRNVKLHDLYIHDVLGEGMYIGNTAPNGSDVVCDGVTKSLLPPRIYNLKIYNVITENTGWDGIQVASAPENVEIYNNSVYNFGTTNKGSQQAGIILGGESNGKVYNNKIIKGTGNALEVFGIGTCYVYNNIIADAGFDGTSTGQDALFVDDRPTDHNFKPLVVYVFNNTVVNSKRDAIRIISSFGTVGTGNLVHNNLVVNAGSVVNIGNAGYINIQKSINFTSSNNVTMADVNAAGFANAAGKDFHLTAGATASIDKGKDLSAYFKYDFDSDVRPQGAAFDVGADEFNASGTANKAPVARAGNDITITLPTSTSLLDGSASSDPDGSISAYKWEFVEGPATPTLTNATTAKATVTKLTAAGIYTFRLTVTDDKQATASDEVNITVKAAAVAPVVKAGTDITIRLPVSTTTLSGSATAASGSTIASYAWTQLSGPATATIASATTASTSISQLTTAGTYSFRLTAKDNNNLSASDTVIVTVQKEVSTAPPVVNAGNTVNITLPVSTASLTGTATPATGSTIASYAWAQISGPVAATIGSPNAAATTVSQLTAAGTYAFKLTAKDNNNLSASDTVNVVVKEAPTPDEPPVVSAGTPATITLPVSTATLTGTATPATGSTIASYTWTEVAGPVTATIATPNAASTTINGLTTPGTYTFRLTAKDSKGLSASDEVTIQVLEAGNIVPIARTGPDQVVEQPKNTTFVDGSASSDEDGTIESYHWVQISGPTTASIVQPDNVTTDLNRLTDVGVYVFRLTVTDNRGGTAVDLISIEIKPAPVPENPVADAGVDQQITLPASTVTLDASGSHGVNSTLTDYTWEMQAGPAGGATISNAGAVNPTVTFTTHGTYTFRLTVTDSKGLTASDNVTIQVLEAGNIPPIAKTGPDQVIEQPKNNTFVDASGSTDEDGTIVSYHWVQISGPSTATIMQPDNVSTDLNRLTDAGTYVFRVTVTDNRGGSSVDLISIEVKPEPVVIENPVADAGADQEITLPIMSATLDASGSHAVNSTLIDFTWEVQSGPSNGARINNDGAVRPTVAFTLPGVYVFRLTVTDANNNTATDFVTITVHEGDPAHEEQAMVTATPNPVVNSLRVQVNLPQALNITIRIVNSNGAIVGTYPLGSVTSYQKYIDVGGWAKGLYLVHVSDGRDFVVTKKIVKVD